MRLAYPQTPRRRGFVLLATAVAMLVLLAMMGLAIDIGHAYVVKNEAQTFTDFAALAAARELDGTSAGVTRAQTAVTTHAMKWNFSKKAFTNNIVEFSADGTAWSATPDANTALYTRVTTGALPVDLYFLQPLMKQSIMPVRAQSVAGQLVKTSFTSEGIGTLPFAPLAHDINDSNFGFTPGDIITLRWPASVKGKKQYCPADNHPQWIHLSTLGGNDERGYIQETSSSAIREAIEDDKIHYTVTLGQPVAMTGGVKATQADSLETRAAQDTNTTATTFSQYKASGTGNNRRLGVVPIVNAENNNVVIGFASVFLATVYDQGGNKPLCAEYVGPYHAAGGSNGGGTPGLGAREVRLVY